MKGLDKKKIEQSIGELEKKVDVELIPVFLTRSDEYSQVFWGLSLILVIISFFLLGSFQYFSYWYFSISVLSSMLLALGLSRVSWVVRALVPQDVIDQEVHQKFVQLFFERSLHHLEKRHALLVGISLIEHRIEIIVGKSISSVVNDQQFDLLIQKVQPLLKKGNFTKVFETLFYELELLLVSDFPKDNSVEEKNEVANTLLCDF